MELSSVFRLPQLESPVLKGLQFKSDIENLDFLQNLAQIQNNFSKVWQNEK
jgi:hypothetical protein